MEQTFANHEKRLLELNLQLDTKYRQVIQAVTDVSKKYPNKKSNKLLQSDGVVIPSRSRGVLTLNQNKLGPPAPPASLLKRPIPLPDKRAGRRKELHLQKLMNVLKDKGKDVSADVHITHDVSSSDENDLEESDPDAPIHEQFWNVNFAETRDSTCELHNEPKIKEPNPSNAQKTIPKQADSKRVGNRSIKPTIDDVIPRKNISSEALIKFLKAKVSILQQELDELKKDKQLRSEQDKLQLEKLQQLTSAQEQLRNQNKTLTEEIERLSKKHSDSTEAIKSKNHDLDQSRRLLDETRKEMSQQSRSNTLLERRLAKITEDLDCVKTNFINSKTTNADLQAKQKQDLGFAEKQLKMLGQQRNGLVAAYKRQLMLLDNLKRQNVCLQQAKLLEFVEQDFMKMLDWNQ